MNGVVHFDSSYSQGYCFDAQFDSIFDTKNDASASNCLFPFIFTGFETQKLPLKILGNNINMMQQRKE